MKKTFNYLVILSVMVGLAIAWNDSQPNWDDTGITVVMILFAAAIFGFLAFEKPWLIALLVSIWIPLWAIVSTHNYGGFLALLPGFAGAYIGYYFRKALVS
jgi:hypothetical protein